MTTKNKTFQKELSIKSVTGNLTLVRDFTRSASAICGFGDESIEKIVLAVDEACTNVIKHAYKNSPEGDITINIKASRGKMTVSITDHGSDFDPTSVPEPDIKEYYRKHKVGGLGIYLMRKLMDEVKYTSAGNKNQVKLIKYLT